MQALAVVAAGAIAITIWLMVFVPDLKNDASYFELRLEQFERWDIVDDIGTDQFTSSFAKGELMIEVVQDKGNELIVRSYEFTQDIVTGEVIWETEETVSVDRNLRKSHEKDAYFLFPLNTQKQDYKFGIFGDKSHEFSFSRELEQNGLTIYEFETTNTYDISGAYEKFPNTKILADQTSKYYVEPITGQIVGFEAFWQDYVEDGEDRVVVSNGDTTTSVYSRDILLAKVQQIILLYNFYDVVIPIFVLASTLIAALSVFIFQSYRSKQKELQYQEKEKFEIIGKVSGNLAHDIRTPLGIIKNSNDMIIHERPKDLFLETVTKNISKSIKKIDYQIEQILEFIKKPKVFYQDASLLEILNESIGTVNIPSKIKIEKPENDIKFDCDPLKLEVLFSNLFVNAIQAINKESGFIKVRWSEKNEALKIEVENSGPNIPKEHLERIFEPLFTTKMEGTGLGLLSCKNIVEAHRGKISAKNDPVTFVIEIPIKRPDSKRVEVTKEISTKRRSD